MRIYIPNYAEWAHRVPMWTATEGPVCGLSLRDLRSDVAARIPPESWEEDWRVMQLPGRMKKERDLAALPEQAHHP